MSSATRIFTIFSLLLLVELISSQNIAVPHDEDLLQVKDDSIIEVSEGGSESDNEIFDSDVQIPNDGTVESLEVNTRVDAVESDVENDTTTDVNPDEAVAEETTQQPEEPSTDPHDATEVNTESATEAPEPEERAPTETPVTTEEPAVSDMPAITVTNPPEPSPSTEPSVAACTEVGVFPEASDCHSYYICSNTPAGLERVDIMCPPKMAFSAILGRCTRDVVSCDDGVTCTVAGRFEDIHNNASFYWCVPKLFGGFHKYHIDCEAGKVFVPLLGKCYIDINNLENLPPYFGQYDDQPDDEDIVKAEMKQLKAEEKAKLKEEKRKEKLEMKRQKELAKKAAKEAKELEKNKNKSKEV